MKATLVVRQTARLMTVAELAAVRRAFPVYQDRDPATRCFARSQRNGVRCQRAWLHYGRCSYPRRSRTMIREDKREPRSNLWWQHKGGT